jgi:hypothetical protein
MRKSLLLVLPALLVAAPSVSSAQVDLPGCTRPAPVTAPFALVAVNGLCTDLSSLITPLAGVAGWNLDTHLTLAGATIDLHVLFDPDPSITLAGSTVNPPTSATTTYAFFFGLPIVPDFYSSAVSTLQLTATSPTGTTTVTTSDTYPAYLSGYGTLGNELTNLGVDLGTAPCVASGTLGSTTCEEGSATETFAPSFYDNLEALLTYTQDNASSAVSFDGDVTLNPAVAITPTPEPATLALVALGRLG